MYRTITHVHEMFTEVETIGATRGRRTNRLERRTRTDDRHAPTADNSSGAVEELDGGARPPRIESRLSWQPSGGSANLGTAAATASHASPTSTTSRGSRQGKGNKRASLAGSRGEKGAASAASRKPREKRAPKKVPGIFGIPVGWSAEDFDYDDSEDENYTPSEDENFTPLLPRNSGSARDASAPSIRCCSPRETVGILSLTTGTRFKGSTSFLPPFDSTS